MDQGAAWIRYGYHQITLVTFVIFVRTFLSSINHQAIKKLPQHRSEMDSSNEQ